MTIIRDALRWLGFRGTPHRRNLDVFEDAGGVKHPIRSSEGYDESLVTHRAAQRERTGATAADQQLGRSFDKFIERGQRKEKAEAKVYELREERKALAETIHDDGASRLGDLIRQAGKERGEVNLIPIGRVLRMTHQRKGNYQAVLVKRSGHEYVPWEFFLDQLAEEHGYADGDALKRGIEARQDDRERLAHLDREIAYAKIVASAGGNKRAVEKAAAVESERRYGEIMSSRPRQKRRRNPSTLAVFAIGALAVGGYLYARGRSSAVLRVDPWPNSGTPPTHFNCGGPCPPGQLCPYNCHVW